MLQQGGLLANQFKITPIEVLLRHLPREIFRATFSRLKDFPCLRLVNLVSFHLILVNFSQFLGEVQMATATRPLESSQKRSAKTPRLFSHFFACFRLFPNGLALFRSFSHFWGCLFLTVFGRLFSALFFALFACCHLAAAI